MVKHLFIILMLFSISNATETPLFEQNCVACHKDMAVKIDKFFYRYLLKYSSEADVKKAMIGYLKNPKMETSILNNDGLIQRFGVKKKTTLNDEELKEAVDQYWEKYKIFNKLK